MPFYVEIIRDMPVGEGQASQLRPSLTISSSSNARTAALRDSFWRAGGWLDGEGPNKLRRRLGRGTTQLTIGNVKVNITGNPRGVEVRAVSDRGQFAYRGSNLSKSDFTELVEYVDSRGSNEAWAVPADNCMALTLICPNSRMMDMMDLIFSMLPDVRLLVIG